jgi:hypothetical protein
LAFLSTTALVNNMNTYLLDEKVRSAAAAAVGLALVWIIAAAVRPTSTYHLAPILVAGVVPILARRPERSAAFLATSAAAGAVVASAAALALTGFDLLRGPTLLPYGGAFAEALTFALVGAVGGLIVGTFIRTD